jgi:hypothetical protein
MVMENMKLPLALVLAMAAQLAAAVWWISDQANTIKSLQTSVQEFADRVAVEDQVNLKRDVEQNSNNIEELADAVIEELEEVWEDQELLWEEANNQAKHMVSIMELQQRVAIIENTLSFTKKDSM